MKRIIGICIVVILLLLIGYFLFERKDSKKPNEILESETEIQQIETEEPVVVSTKEQEEYQYVIFAEDERLVVYCSDNVTIYMNTAIKTKTLPENIRNKLKNGIRFQTQQQLYDFLESYSS